MVKVSCKEDCGNAPKKILLRDFNFAVARGNLSRASRYLAEEVTWHLFEPAGQKQIHGRENVIAEYEGNLVIEPVEFIVDSIITHGVKGAVNGSVKAKDGRSYVFCDVYQFSSHTTSARIKEMTSYIIEKMQILEVRE